MNDREYTASDYVKGGVFLLWFIGSIVGLFISATNAPWLAISVFGQFFLVIGLIILYTGIRDGNLNPIMLLFLFIGLLATIFGVVMQFGSESVKELFQKLIPYFGIGIFFVTGILAFATSIVRNSREKNCTQLVRATCVEIKSRRRQTQSEHMSTQHYLYCPVFSFHYNGKAYEVCSNFYSLDVDAELGQQYDLYINPDHPKCFKESGESLRQNNTELGIGIFFTVFSVIGFILLFILL